MDLNQVDTLVNILIYIAGGLGTVGLAIILTIFRYSLRLNKNETDISSNKEDITEVRDALIAHDQECKIFRREVNKRFDDGSEEFKKIHRSLGKIEGLLESKVKK